MPKERKEKEQSTEEERRDVNKPKKEKIMIGQDIISQRAGRDKKNLLFPVQDSTLFPFSDVLEGSVKRSHR